jgi:aminocarboxymuconate-semialdehyde decarboxylase
MDRDGISVQIVSPMPELFSYAFDPAKSAALCDVVNAATAALVAEAPDRFAGFGIVTMQDPELAVRQVGELRTRFGLSGIEIGSNIAGTYAGDPRFHIVYEAAAAARLPVFVHAFHPLSAGAGGLSPAWTPFAGFASDIGHAAASFIAHDIPAHFRSLELIFSHGGGTLSAMLGRLDRGFAATSGFGGTIDRLPSAIAARFLYDSNVYDPAQLRHLTREFAPGRVLLGTDYPYDIMQTDPLAYLHAALDPVGAQAVASAGAMLIA